MGGGFIIMTENPNALKPSTKCYTKTYLDSEGLQFSLYEKIPTDAVKLLFSGLIINDIILPNFMVEVNKLKDYKFYKVQLKVKAKDNYFAGTKGPLLPAQTFRRVLYQVLQLSFKDGSKMHFCVDLETGFVMPKEGAPCP